MADTGVTAIGPGRMVMEDEVIRVLAELNKPYDPIEIVINLLAHAVYDENRSDECYDAVHDARGYLEQEGVE